MYYTGIDLHWKTSFITTIDSEGRIVKKANVANDTLTIFEFFLYDIGSLIVSITIPKALTTYVSEARHCYAFKQYNAVYGLWRTILETAIRHACERRGHQKNNGNVCDFESYHPYELINNVSEGKLKQRLKDI